MLAFFSAIGGLSALLLLLVPVGRVTLNYPDRVVFGMSCTTGYPISLSLYQEHPCKSKNHPNETEVQLESCGFACQAILPENRSDSILKARSYGLQVYNLEKNTTNTYTYTLTAKDVNASLLISETLNHKRLKNNERFLTSIRKLSKNSYYFPTATLFNFSCDLSTGSFVPVNCAFGAKDLLDQFYTRLGGKFKTIVQPQNLSPDDLLEDRQIYSLTVNKNKETNCLNGFAKSGQHISITIPIEKLENSSETSKHLDLGSCSSKCIFTAPRKDICFNDKQIIERDMRLTFWSYLVVRVFIGIVSGTSFAMFEGAVIAILREHKADYGLQRIYATIGGMISSPLSGFLVDFASSGKGYTDFRYLQLDIFEYILRDCFRPIFFLYFALKIISAFLMLFINLEFKKPAQSVVADVIQVLKKLELIALFLACLILGKYSKNLGLVGNIFGFLGCAWGYIESFLFWLLQDLGGSKSLMGLTITVAGLVGIPLLVLSGPLIKKIGHANVIFIGFAFYAVRLVGYSLIYNPWLCLIFEAMEAVTFGLSFTAAVTYTAKLSTMTTDTTIQGLLGGIYYAVGM